MENPPKIETPPAAQSLVTNIRCFNCGYSNDRTAVSCIKCGNFLKIPVKERSISGSIITPNQRTQKKNVAQLRFPDKVIDLSNIIQKTFGRSDFKNYLTKERSLFITRVMEHRCHFMIEQRGGDFYIQDSKSSNGTLLNGSQIRNMGGVKLNNNDVINPAGVLDLIFTINKI